MDYTRKEFRVTLRLAGCLSALVSSSSSSSSSGESSNAEDDGEETEENDAISRKQN
jgi:hypothetical protein